MEGPPRPIVSRVQRPPLKTNTRQNVNNGHLNNKIPVLTHQATILPQGAEN